MASSRTTPLVGVIKAGSFSLKFAVHEGEARLLSEQVEGIDLRPALRTAGFGCPVQAALESAVRYLELGPKGIRVHAVSPGPLATRAALGIRGLDEMMTRVPARAPVRRLENADGVDAACVFLASPYAAAMTGETLYIDGGHHILPWRAIAPEPTP